METAHFNEILTRIAIQEKRAKRRAIVFTVIPLIFAIILIGYTTSKVAKAQEELLHIDSTMAEANKKIKAADDSLQVFKKNNILLQKENDSLIENLHKSLGKAVAVMSEFKVIIDKIKPSLRTVGETAFYVNFRMMEERIRGDYDYLSEKISSLPQLYENKSWIVIVKSSVSLTDLKSDVPKLVSIYDANQIAIYKSSPKYYSLCVVGNGTFTRAYRLNVELRDRYGYNGAYFSSSENWGDNYLIR